MPELIMACAKLKTAMSNKTAVERYTIMHDLHYSHPGWVEMQNKNSNRNAR